MAGETGKAAPTTDAEHERKRAEWRRRAHERDERTQPERYGNGEHYGNGDRYGDGKPEPLEIEAEQLAELDDDELLRLAELARDEIDERGLANDDEGDTTDTGNHDDDERGKGKGPAEPARPRLSARVGRRLWGAETYDKWQRESDERAGRAVAGTKSR